MFRSLHKTRWFLLLTALAGLAFSFLPARPGLAATYTYSTRQRVVNAGVLYIGSGSDALSGAGPYPANPAPFVFRVLDQRLDVKPVGWTFVNPLAPSQVTQAMVRRWGVYTAGAPLDPTMAAYWEVPLRDVSADQLQQFDVLYLHASYNVNGVGNYTAQFSPADNEKLRRFVDGGGQLIVEYGAAATDNITAMSNGQFAQNDAINALFADVQWHTNPVPAIAPSFLHPLVSQPYLLDVTDYSNLGMSSDTNVYGYLTPGNGDYNALFGDAIDRLTPTAFPAVVGGQLGAGQVVATSLELGRDVTLSTGALFGLQNLSKAPTADLKLLSNAISWIDTHPTENKTSHQNASGPSAASFAPAWSYPAPNAPPLGGTNAPPAPAVWGNFVFVTDSVGVLHCFDGYPSEGLLGQPDGVGGILPDDGIQDFIKSPPTPFDEVWNAKVGSGASAPTVGSFFVPGPTGGYLTYVMVERADGSVLVFNALGTIANTSPIITLTPLAIPGATPFPNGVNAPAPTYYDGRIYAGQPNGDLFVYNLIAGTSASAPGVRVPLNPSASGEYVTASLAVGLLANGDTTNTVIAYVSTNQNLYTVLLGARNDALVAYNNNGTQVGYNLNRRTEYNLPSVVVDMASVPAPSIFDANGSILAGATPNPTIGQDPVFTTTTQGSYFTNWDVDYVNSLLNKATLTLHEIKATSYQTTNNFGQMSAPAMDRQGDYYYTVNDQSNSHPNSYIIGVHPDLLQRNVRLKFRFRLPYLNDPSTVNPNPQGNAPAQWSDAPLDADSVDYRDTAHNGQYSLMGFQFVGAPVADSQGNVYVAAEGNDTVLVNGTPTSVPAAAVLCFNANQEITADPHAPGAQVVANFDPTQASYQQADENIPNQPNSLLIGGTTGNANTIAAHYGQVIASAGRVSVYNFGRNSSTPKQIAGNLTEPQPFTAVPSPSQNPASQTTWMYFHTNLAWYTTFPVNGTVSGLSLVGNTLMLTDSGNNSAVYNTLYKLPANPSAIGIGKLVTVGPSSGAPATLISVPLGTQTGGTAISIGSVAAAPSAGGGVMAINGSNGLVGFNQELTLIADNNRILQVDNDGNAVWSADATTRVQANGTTTKVDFAHPTSLSPVAANDYLVADTGNNRCVRFNHGGTVLWEMTRFNDPNGLMAPGQSQTLNHPSSVELRKQTVSYLDKNTSAPGTATIYHYLVADTGNERIVEVTDIVGSNGLVLWSDNAGGFSSTSFSNAVYQDHILTWVSHTADQFGRHYQYAGATYLVIPKTQSGNAPIVEVFALVTNTRIAPLTPLTATTYALAPASSDAPGGSIVAFLPQSPQPPFSQLTAQPSTTTDLVYVANSFTIGSTANAQTYPVRSPRFLHVYAPPQAVAKNPPQYLYSFLYADDNGAFDLCYTGPNTPPANNVQANVPFPGFPGFNGLGFLRNFYSAMKVPVAGIVDISGAPYRYPRGGIPFVPTCIQRLNDDNTSTPRYLITQSYGQSELGMLAPVSRIGGEIFEVDVDSTGISNAVGGFGGGIVPATTKTPSFFSGFTLSRPGSAGPLTQPTFAIRTSQ